MTGPISRPSSIPPGSLVRIRAEASIPDSPAGWILFDTLEDSAVIVPHAQSTAMFLGSNNDPEREEVGAAPGLVLWESRILEVPPSALEVVEDQ